MSSLLLARHGIFLIEKKEGPMKLARQFSVISRRFKVANHIAGRTSPTFFSQ